MAPLKGPALLRHLRARDFQARFADGTPLPREPGALEIGLRWIKCEDEVQYFVVGTQSDFDHVRRRFEIEESRYRETGRDEAGAKRQRRRHRPSS